ncbi:hypothetical protein DK45_3472 [Bordetella bronchiseptica]|nr:hypothetical protein DK45_3472 [Bordetella bronchiseptica]
MCAGLSIRSTPSRRLAALLRPVPLFLNILSSFVICFARSGHAARYTRRQPSGYAYKRPVRVAWPHFHKA